MCPPCNANQLTCSDPYAACVCPWPPLHSNANPLVCLTFQWCSGHLNSILCRCSKQWGPCQGESQQQQRRQNKRWRAHLASNKNLFRKTWNTSVASSSPTFPSLAPASLTPRGEGVSDLRPGWDAVSMQTAQSRWVTSVGAGTWDSLWCLEVKRCIPSLSTWFFFLVRTARLWSTRSFEAVASVRRRQKPMSQQNNCWNDVLLSTLHHIPLD